MGEHMNDSWDLVSGKWWVDWSRDVNTRLGNIERLILPDEADLQLRDAVARLTHQATVLDDWGMGRTARAHRGARLLLLLSPWPGDGHPSRRD